MKLLLHNLLRCHVKGVQNGFPHKIEVGEVKEIETELDLEFLRRMFDRIHWGALVQGARDLGYAELPEQATAAMLDDADFAKKFHHALLELQLVEGALVCPETGRKFAVHKGVPNMRLTEDEV